MSSTNTTEIATAFILDEVQCPTASVINYSHIILFISNSIALLISLIVCWSSFRNFKKLSKLNTSLKFLFGLSIISTWLCIIPSVLIVVFCQFAMTIPSRVSVLLTVCGYLLLFLSLLGTLLTRLSETFSDSIYQISNKQRNSFIFLYILILMLSSITAITAAMQIHSPDGDKIGTIFLVVTGFTYLSTAIWTVYIFTEKLMKLTQTQARTMHNVLNVESNKFFSPNQQKLITSITKYVGLFTVASATSVISILVIFIGYLFSKPLQYHGEWTLVIAGVDCMINIICLFLQYSFSNKYYQIYCKFSHLCFHKMITKRLRKSIENIYSQNKQKLDFGNGKYTNIKIHEREKLKSRSEEIEDESGHDTYEEGNGTII